MDATHMKRNSEKLNTQIEEEKAFAAERAGIKFFIILAVKTTWIYD